MANMFINAMTDLWNSAGTSYTAIKMNVTNAASMTSPTISKLIDLQVGGTSKFSVDKNGAVVTASTISTTGALLPAVSDGAALGSTTFQWSDLYGASTFTLNIGNGNWVGTHSSGIFTVSTGDLRVTTAGTNAASAVTVGGTQTLTAKTLTAPVIATITNGAATLTLPTTTDTLVGKATTDTLTNKSLTSPTVTGTPTATGATWASLGTATTIDINGGTIDGTTIGASSRSTGLFTTLGVNGAVTFSAGGAMSGTFDGGTYTGAAFNGTLGASTPSTASVTTLTASSTVLLSPASANVNMSPTGTGTVTISPATAGTINNVAIGGSTPLAGAFTTLTASNAVALSPANANVVISPTGIGAVVINPATTGTLNNVDIGAFTAATGRFTTVTINTSVIPDANNGASLGTQLLGWAEVNLGTGGEIGWANRDVTISHSTNELIFAGASTGYQFDAPLLIAGAAAGQIQFPSSQNASADANTLDDYQEGTWSAAVAFTGASTGVTYTSQTGHYTKIGDRVFFTVFIRLSAKGSSTGAMSISLPPFTILNAVSGITFQVGNYSNFTGLTGSLSASASGGGSTCSIQQHGATGTANVTDAAVTATMGIAVSGHYPAN